MQLKMKLGIIFILGAIACFYISYWSVNKSFNEQMSGAQKEYVEKGLEFGEKLAQAKLIEISQQMDRMVETQNIEEKFKAIALVQFDNGASQWISRKVIPSSREDLKAYFNENLLQLPLESVNEDKTLIFSLQNKSQQFEFFIAKKVKVKVDSNVGEYIALAVTSPLLFSNFSNLSKSHKTELILTNSLGSALAYPEQPYVGRSVQKLPYIEDALNARELLGVEFKKDQNLYIGYKKVPNSNITVISRSPEFKVVASVAQLSASSYVYLFATILLFLTFFFLIFLDGFKENEYLLSSISKMAKGNVLVKPSFKFKYYTKYLKQLEDLATKGFSFQSAPEKSFNDGPTLQAVPGDQLKEIEGKHRQQLQDLSDGIVQLLKGPLTSIMGQIQVAKTNLAENKESIEQLNVIEQELRDSRNVIEGFINVKEETYSSNKLLLDVVQQAVGRVPNVTVKAPDLMAGVFYKGPEKSLQQLIGGLISYLKNSLDFPNKEQFVINFNASSDDKVNIKISSKNLEFTSKLKEKLLEPQNQISKLSDRERVDLIVLKGLFERSMVSVVFADENRSLCIVPSTQYIEVNKVKKVAQPPAEIPSQNSGGITKEDIQKQVSQAALELKASGLIEETGNEIVKKPEGGDELASIKALADKSKDRKDPPSPNVKVSKDEAFVGETKAHFIETAFPKIDEAHIQKQLQEEFEKSLADEEKETVSEIIEDSANKSVESMSLDKTEGEVSENKNEIIILGPPMTEVNKEEALGTGGENASDIKSESPEPHVDMTFLASEKNDDKEEEFSFGPAQTLVLEDENSEPSSESSEDEKYIKIRRPKLQNTQGD